MSTNLPPTADLSVSTASSTSPADLPPAPSEPHPLCPPMPDEVQREGAIVAQIDLSEDLMWWIARYEQVGDRDRYLWKWVRQGVEITTLSSVDAAFYDAVCDTKVLGVMLDVLLDDIADHGGDPVLLEQLLQLPFGPERLQLSGVAAEDEAYAELTLDVWDEIKRRTQGFPHFDSFATVWRYDYLQLFNAMRYSHMINQDIALLNMAEHDLYLPHNMHIMISATVDLMCSSVFRRSELGRLREAVWNAQCMGRIGNLATTWQRELGEGDFTSGVYARAVAEGALSSDDLQQKAPEEIVRVIRDGGHEAFFFQRWLELRQRLIELVPNVQSVDLARLLAGYERLIRLHLISRGQK